MEKQIKLLGKLVDNQSRCEHYNSSLDIIAIKFKCCKVYYPCFQCHQELADHLPMRWPETEWDEKAILCGVCKHELSISAYLDCGNICPNCQAHFNPGCKSHYHLYFEKDVNVS